jgi:hypothetical protein
LFFLGILTAVAALQTAGHLILLADFLREYVGNLYVINVIIGVLSSIVDNVPLVAAAMGMYNFPPDHFFWEFLAYCAGTGGSILIIGSAAGVAVMGMEKIDFIWYMKKISLLALVGYLAGAGTYYLQEESGIFNFEDEEQAIMINLDSRSEVIKYLTTYEFHSIPEGTHVHEGGEGDFIHFIRVDHQGEIYLGYSGQHHEHGEEAWDGKLEPGNIGIEKLGADQVKINFLDKTYHMNSAGELVEPNYGNKQGYNLEWKRTEFEEE